MNGRGWWVVDLAVVLLDRAEREAVRGDLAESSDGAGRALVGVLGLVARRQMALWRDWRPWVVLLAVVPLGAWLGLQSAMLARSYDLYVWIGRNYQVMDRALLHQTGLASWHGIFILVRRSLLLVAGSWTAGFAVSAVARRARWVNGVMFGLVMFGANRLASPKHYYYYVNGEAYPLGLAAPMLSLIVVAVLVALPSVWGMISPQLLSAIGAVGPSRLADTLAPGAGRRHG